MRKRRGIVIFAAAIALAVAIAFFLLLPAREPCYQGRSLTAWLRLVNQHPTNPSEAEAARNAVIKIGTNALPLLLKWTKYPTLTVSLRIRLEEARRKPFGRWCIPESLIRNCAERFQLAGVGLGILGPLAAPAAPELSRKLRSAPDWNTANLCVSALCGIGLTGVPYLCEVITNASPRGWTNAPIYWTITDDMSPRVTAIKHLIGMGTNTDRTLPVFIQAMNDNEASVAAHAVLAIGIKGRGHPSAVPALTNALLDPRRIIRASAADSLYRLGKEAQPAVPCLLKALNDQDSTVRQWATNALIQIAPGALAQDL